jgi:hypothetical protein
MNADDKDRLEQPTKPEAPPPSTPPPGTPPTQPQPADDNDPGTPVGPGKGGGG